MRITFGKHKGTEIADLPLSYLQWLIDADVRMLSPAQRAEVLRVLEGDYGGNYWKGEGRSTHRGGDWGEASSRAHKSLGGVQLVVPAQRLALMAELIECGFRALATKLHPDRGGTTEQMQQLNELRVALKEQLAK